MKNFKLFKEGKTDINDLKKKYLEFVVKNVFEPNMGDYLALKNINENPYINTYLLKNEEYGYMIKVVYEMEEGGHIEKEHFSYEGNKFSEKETYIEDEDDNYEYTSFIEDYSDIIQKINMGQYIDSIKQTKDALVKLNEQKINISVEKAYLSLLEEKFSSMKETFFSINTAETNPEAFMHFYELELDSGMYYFVIYEDRITSAGDLEEIASYFYIPEEEKFVEYSASSDFMDIIYKKYYDKYHNVMAQLDYDEMYDIFNDQPLSVYHTADGEFRHLRTIEIREWIQIEEERNELFRKVNEGVDDIKKDFFRVVKSLSDRTRKKIKDGEEVKNNVVYELHKIDEYYFLMEIVTINNHSNYHSYIYVDELRDFATDKWLVGIRDYHSERDDLTEEEADDYIKASHKYSNLLIDNKLDKSELIIKTDTKGIQQAIDDTFNAYKSINESVDTNKLFIGKASELTKTHIKNAGSNTIKKEKHVNCIYSLYEHKKDDKVYYLFLEDQTYDVTSLNQKYFIYIEEENTFEDKDWVMDILLNDNHHQINIVKALEYDQVLSDFKSYVILNKQGYEFELIIQKDIYEMIDAIDATTAAVVSMNEKKVKTFESFIDRSIPTKYIKGVSKWKK